MSQNRMFFCVVCPVQGEEVVMPGEGRSYPPRAIYYSVMPGLDPGIHDESHRMTALRSSVSDELPHGLPGQVYSPAGRRPDPVARQ